MAVSASAALPPRTPPHVPPLEFLNWAVLFECFSCHPSRVLGRGVGCLKESEWLWRRNNRKPHCREGSAAINPTVSPFLSASSPNRSSCKASCSHLLDCRTRQALHLSVWVAQKEIPNINQSCWLIITLYYYFVTFYYYYFTCRTDGGSFPPERIYFLYFVLSFTLLLVHMYVHHTHTHTST